MGSRGVIKYHAGVAGQEFSSSSLPSEILGETNMKSRCLSTALVACCLLFAAPALAQGVKIGILNDQSGVYADYGGKYSVEAAKMAAEDFGGSVLGEKIEIVSADHQNKPDLATSIARRWYEVEGVVSSVIM